MHPTTPALRFARPAALDLVAVLAQQIEDQLADEVFDALVARGVERDEPLAAR